MPYVLTVDQVRSRHTGDAVTGALRSLRGLATLLPFERTVGDEFQGLLSDPLSVSDAILGLMRSPFTSPPGARWHVGLGVGPVERPLPASPRSARGPAFVAARAGVDRAKRQARPVCVEAADHAAAADAETMLRLLDALWDKRTANGWEAVGLAESGLSQAEAANRLGISRQAVSDRLATAGWSLEQDARAAVQRLIARLESR